MACKNCGNGGCGTLPAGCRNNGSCGTTGCNKLEVFDWLAGMELAGARERCPFVEVRFKNTRKEYFRNSENLELHVGDVVAVEATSGHDVGTVSLTGELVRLQMNKKGVRENSRDVRRIYRKAHQADIDKWQEARQLEKPAMLKTRNIVTELKLDMKVSDVEYQGDKSKATFYYIAEERVDFRELIRVLASQFGIRVEMRQIGSRQEAGRVGGIGSCGRELCCSTWLTDFRSVSTSAARYQQLAINPMKLAGQCGKLKCCLNYELDSYLDALKEFPDTSKPLLTEKGRALHQKTDIFKKVIWYAYEDNYSDFIAVSLHDVKEALALNEKGQKAPDLKAFGAADQVESLPEYGNVVGQDSLTRFDQKTKKRKKKKKRNNQNPQKR